MDYQVFEGHRRKAGTIADLLIDQPRLDIRTQKTKKDPRAALYTIQKYKNKRLDLLPAELSLAWVVKNPAQMDYRLEKLLAGIRDGYDYISSKIEFVCSDMWQPYLQVKSVRL
jgi:cellulose biosynthesis protein BcsQ